MAWGSQGAVFLGEDLVHTRDYSDETARVIDEEVERILRDEENRTRAMLTEHRAGSRRGRRGAARARDARRPRGRRLVDDAMGHKGGGPRRALRADGTEEVIETTGDGDSLVRLRRIAPLMSTSLRPSLRGGRAAPARRLAPVAEVGFGGAAGSRSSATAAHRSVAVNAPTNARRTTPSWSAMSVMGMAASS